MRVESLDRPVTSARLMRVARRLLDAARLCAIATKDRGDAYVNTAYFAWTARLEIVWISSEEARHSRNLRADPTCAIAVFDTHQTWGGNDRGIQLFGRARLARGRARTNAKRAYGKRFRAYDPKENAGLPPYVFTPTLVKLFHEGEFGGATWVVARVRSGRLVWQRTERYDAG